MQIVRLLVGMIKPSDSSLQHSEASSTSSARPFRSRIVVASFLILALLAGLYLWRQRSVPEPPVIPHDGLEPLVARSIDQAEADVRTAPRSGQAWGRLGKVLLAHQFLSEAETCFAQAEVLDPREPRWPYYQGKILIAKDLERSLPKLQRAVELCGDEPDAPRLELANLLLAQGRAEDAEREFRALVQHRPGHPPAELGLARLALEANHLPESLGHARRAAESLFTRRAAHCLIASIHERQGDRKAAERELGNAATLPDDPNWPDPFTDEYVRLQTDKRSRLQQATQLLNQNRGQEAIAPLNDLLRTYPEWDLAWRALGHAYFQGQDYAHAQRALEKALQFVPDSLESQYLLGCTASLRGDNDKALASFRKTVQLKPDYAIGHYNVGLCLRAQGKGAEALDAFRAALRCQPFLAPAQRDLGELLAQAGKRIEAIEHLRQAVDLDPSDRQARKLLEQVGGSAPTPDPR